MSKIFYLAHPFESRELVREWELGAEKRLGIELVNPFFDVPRADLPLLDVTKVMTREERQKALVETFGMEYGRAIVEPDLSHIRDCGGVVAVVTDDRMVGTPMEIFYTSYVLKRPVYIIHLSERNRWHPWLQYFSVKMFSGFADFEAWWKAK
jgi:hypothetical protein